MKIGILGGSFDPIHNGHIYMAKQVYEKMKLDQIWLIPSGHSPNKIESQMTKATMRLEMCQLVASKYDFLYASDIEVCSDQISYTYLTLEKLTNQYPNHEFYFIMGADSLDYFDKWVHPELIAKYSKILVINRDSFSKYDLEEKIKAISMLFPCQISIVECDKMNIASREIRQAVKNGTNQAPYLDSDVYSYILNNHLYEA